MKNSEFELLSEVDLRKRYERGDYVTLQEQIVAKKWLARKVKDHKFLEACELASKSAALDARKTARRANMISSVSLFISCIAAKDQILSLVNFIINKF